MLIKCCECNKQIEVFFVAQNYDKVVCDECCDYEYKDGEEDFLNNQREEV